MFAPYGQVEILTVKYGKQFAQEYRQSGLIENIEYYKVFSYDEHYAQVYYVEEGHSTRNFMVFARKGQEWKLESWQCLWSASGSADDFVWPFYP